jgi:hypothetical protein
MQNASKLDHYIRVGAWLILALALLPNISYMGHWTKMAGATHDHADTSESAEHSADDSATAAHAAHCHVGPANCGGGESMIGTPFVGEDTEGLALSGHEFEIDTERMLIALSGHATPLLQPPRSA